MNTKAVTRLPAFLTALLALIVAGCANVAFDEYAAEQLADKPGSQILVIGDSVMWWHRDRRASIGDAIGEGLGEWVVNLAVPGARISFPEPDAIDAGLDIAIQYRRRDWRWVVIVGGANDLAEECDCERCDSVMDQLISSDGATGEYPDLVQRIVADGSRVVVLGYYPPPAAGGDFAACEAELDELSNRIERLASRDADVIFVPMAAVIDPDVESAYDRDLVHPSVSSSRAIGLRIAAKITSADLEDM
ncbi:MAG: SGNH/GDSL hydrolase family protein [Pseudomonadota bacterium]